MSRTVLVPAIVFFAALNCALSAQRDSMGDNGAESAGTLLDLARKGLAVVEKPLPGVRDPDHYFGVFIWSKRLLNAELNVSTNREERIAAREKYLERMIKLENTAKDFYARHMISYLELLENEYQRCEAQAQLAWEREALSQK